MKRHFFIKDMNILFLIISAPFLFFLYLFVPDQPSFKIFGFIIESGSYESIATLAWYSVNYFLAFALYCIWFITCKSWWRYTILILIYFEYRKLHMMIDDSKHLITSELIVFFYGLVILVVLLFISKRIGYYSNKKTINKQLDDEIDFLITQVSNFKRTNYKKSKIKLIELRKLEKELDKIDYLKKLIKLRDEFFIEEKS